MADLKLGFSRGDFHEHSVHTFQSLLEDINFSDVTLVCEDQKQLKGHKVILSSASEFFKNILEKNPHPNPLIYIKVKYDLLYSILKFIYLGQCEIEQSDIESFLECAKDLQISGLCSEMEEDITTSTEEINMRKRENKMEIQQEFQELVTKGNCKLPERNISTAQDNSYDEEYIKEEEMSADQVGEPIAKDLDGLMCNQCGKVQMCEASFIVHKRNAHRITKKKETQTEPKRIISKDLSYCTKRDRLFDINLFKKYVSIQAGRPLDEVLSGEDGRDVLQEMFFGFFSTFRKRDGKLPSKPYISKLRSSINCVMIEEYRLDLVNRELCPEFNARWKDIVSQFNDYICPKCGMEFTERINLKSHRETHKSESSHNCETCGRSFSDVKGLSRHVKNKHF